MAIYRVRVRTEHLEDYYVDAESEDEARDNWSYVDMDMDQCTEVLGIESVELEED